MFQVPTALKWMENSPAGRDWLRALPARVAACRENWKLELEAPYQGSFVSVVFPAQRSDGTPAVLKVQYPHAESEHEEEALRLWNGEGTVKLFDYDPQNRALLLERCEPGDHLSTVQAGEALEVFTQLLPRLWIKAGKPFRMLADEAAGWLQELPANWERAGRPFERALLEAALEGLDHLRGTQGEQVLIHQDLHGDNVLRAAREPWLVIDPKPLVGEREMSLAPIIRGYEFGHSRDHVIHRLDRLTEALRLNRERTRLWSLGQTLAWGFEGTVAYDKHMETARWLWRA
jgi:streptomycin 6-kinase